MSETLANQKQMLRKHVLAKRDAIDPAHRIEFSLQAADHAAHCPVFQGDYLQPGTIVAAFLPIRSEVDARPLMALLATKGARLCLPVVLDKETIIFRELLREAELVDTGFGTVGPGEDAAILDPEIMIVPLSAFDKRGGRMGYGAGHYDRAIARLQKLGKKPRLVGLAFSAQEVAEVPMEPHDQTLEAIITERGVFSSKGSLLS